MAKVRVYQLDIEHENKFMSYQFACNHGGIHRKDYRTVFKGELPTNDLEGIYLILNSRHPEGYKGHSLSVSDVITVEGLGTFYVDSFGFSELFDFEVKEA
ncbi:MAG: hypothetical protein IKL53_10280 [Lachnospiraceae bacterium]|nr:hypothetical protein [Lachnospiraceae bacterium]